MGEAQDVDGARGGGGAPAAQRGVLRAVWPGLVLVLAGVLGFALLLDALRDRDDLWTADGPLLEWLVAHRSDGLTTALTAVTTVFGPVVLPVLVAAGALVWARVARDWWDPALTVGAMLLSTLLSMLLKGLVARPRPEAELMSVAGLETSFSFPSGHTIGASTLVLVTGYLVWRRTGGGRALAVWALVSVVVVVLVGGSRLYLGYHFLTDVLAGVCVGVAVLGLVVAVDRWHRLARGRGAP
ncbi:phosphatase PAP2 family protein [Cellulomonas sp. PhB143]|uniref:phosphatase PAP2 family protein n=1 Tax=Cellulomonas sp. PhB143 TaxID=2485186 RepID=UPI000F4A333C|nr:phosphatase PAP2 family protein [Cellulomonas sp. PhB143]ROS77032.1 undecaprenyl-diphosphatase [Cellulomonas sp. PhB143]